MVFNLKYGKSKMAIMIESKNYKGSLLSNISKNDISEDTIIEKALANPIASKRLKDSVSKGDRVVIVTSDITRPMPSYKVLPYMIKALKQGGVLESDIEIVLALGSHRPHTQEELVMLLGENIVKSPIKITDHDMTQTVNHGICKNGTPIDIAKNVSHADRVICLGNIEYHYFAGYSGGAKAIMPGVSSYKAIQANHKNMVKEKAVAGNLETNPVRQDIDEVGEKFKIDFLFNVILNENKEIIEAFAGHWKYAHRKGCRALDAIYGIEVDRKAEIVIASPGGYPKDMNLYQSQKALDNAKHAVQEKGVIIFVAECREGFGSQIFEEWILNKSPEEMVSEIKRDFKLGGHKAAAIGQILLKNDIYWVSSLEEGIVKQTGMKPFGSLEAAYKAAIEKMGTDAQVIAMPMAASTMPIIRNM